MMPLQKFGGLSSIILALTYLFGFGLFFGVLNTSELETTLQRLEYFIKHRDCYFIGFVVIGTVFSFFLLALVQAVHKRLKPTNTALNNYAQSLGKVWAGFVLASSFIFLSSIPTLSKISSSNTVDALPIYQSLMVVVDALGGGIELIGAIWLIMISYLSLRAKVFHFTIHYWGMLVGICGVLTLFTGLSQLEDNALFSVTTDLFGLGQIIWFIAFGIAMLREPKYQETPNLQNS